MSLLISLYKEFRWLRTMTLEDRVQFKSFFRTQCGLPLMVFIFFQLMIWRAVMQSSIKHFETAMYTALTYTLFFASLRSVILVGASFSAIVTLHNCKNTSARKK